MADSVTWHKESDLHGLHVSGNFETGAPKQPEVAWQVQHVDLAVPVHQAAAPRLSSLIYSGGVSDVSITSS